MLRHQGCQSPLPSTALDLGPVTSLGQWLPWPYGVLDRVMRGLEELEPSLAQTWYSMLVPHGT